MALAITISAGLSLLPLLGSAAPLAIHVSGNHLVDGAGKTIQLRGANVSGTEYSCDQGSTAPYGWSIYAGQPLDQLSTYQAMQAWGINVVRVPLNEDCWLSINQVDPAFSGANYRNAIQTEVNLIQQAGMYPILDLHWSAPGSASAQAQNPEPDQDHSPAFWQSVATTYKSNPAVIFELFNEPFDYWGTNPDPWAGWLNGDTQTQYQTGGNPYTVNLNWQTAGMQELINTVRATGATQPIMANGLDWANDMSGWLSHAPSDPQHQLIAGWHSYPGELCADTACWDQNVAPITQTYPVVVTETGDSSAGPVTFLPGFFNWADAHGLSYLAWTWNPWQHPDNVLVKDWNGTPTAGEGLSWQAHLALRSSSSQSAPAQTGANHKAALAPSPVQADSPSPTNAPAPNRNAALAPCGAAITCSAHWAVSNQPVSLRLGLLVFGVLLLGFLLFGGLVAMMKRRGQLSPRR